MKKYGLLMLVLSVIFLALFGVVEALKVPLLTDPGEWLAGGKVLAATVGFALLTLDVFLPVPASLVMIAHGAVFGPVVGTLLSLVGGLAAGALGFAVGRWWTPWLTRLLSETERQRAEDWLRRWGDVAVVASRPVPILAESIAILAGTTPMTWTRFLLASFAGYVPAAALYAVTGATAVRLDSTALVFGLVLAIAGAFWLVGRRMTADDGVGETT